MGHKIVFFSPNVCAVKPMATSQKIVVVPIAAASTHAAYPVTTLDMTADASLALMWRTLISPRRWPMTSASIVFPVVSPAVKDTEEGVMLC